ncbi:WcaA Glycosyltransferases involved in cell wall biogenesis [Flavobacteriaceae bacterium]
MKLSIIIPVYNAEKTINHTVQSILNQLNNRFNIEFIICNDGSTDNSLDILNNLASEHHEIKLFDNENQGVYKTRNFCFEQVSGDYVWFIDSDDLIIENALSIIYEKFNKEEFDVMNFGYVVEKQKDKIEKKFPPYFENCIDGITFLENNDGRLYLWNNIYSINFLKGHSIRFLAKSVSLEDSLFNIEVFSKAKKVICLQKLLYTYCFNQNSISRTKSIHHLINQGTSSFNVHSSIQDIRNNYKINSKEFNVINVRLMHSVLGFFYSLLVEKYPLDYIKKMYVLYRENKFLPVKMKNISLQLFLFQYIINLRHPFLLLCKINKKL